MNKKFQVNYQTIEEQGENSSTTEIYEYDDEAATVADVLRDFYKSHNENEITGIAIRKMGAKEK